jgi:two-component system OmpR family sensor kinase
VIYRSLYSRLAFTLFVLLCLVGLILNQIIRQTGSMYQQEVSQKLNTGLARHIVQEESLIRQGKIDQQALDHLFHQLMAVNPGVEIYLLDQSGEVLGYSAPNSSIKRKRVDPLPIRQFLDEQFQYPIMGDDPRSSDRKKIFSAAEIIDSDGLQGYLYIIIEGEKYDHIVELLEDSYIFDSALIVLLGALAIALASGLFIFSILTRRLGILGVEMRRYSGKTDHSKPNDLKRLATSSNDEIGQLSRHFKAMAERIDDQFNNLSRLDGMRRDLVANVSHDLRTPLTTMRGYLETLLIKNGSLTEADERQYLETALAHSKRLAGLIDELFELARLDSCESMVYAEPFSMGELVQDVAQSFELRTRQKNISLELDINSDTPLIYADIAMMQRVLENLLENGLRHTPEGGCIQINVDIESARVVVRVADTGCGIAADDVPLIFERFYMPKNNHQGTSTGLGLAIVKRILELHGSVIKVRSQINRGTTFTFSMASTSSS